MLISNPLASELLLPAAYRLVGLLAGILVVLLFLARHRLRRLGQDVLFRRWGTWAVITPLYLLAVLGGQITMLLLVSFLVFQGLREYAQLVGLPRTYLWVLLAMGVAAAPIALLSLEGFQMLPPVLLIVATLQPLAFGRTREGVRHLAFAALGWGYLAWFLVHLLLVHQYIAGGAGILLAIGLGVALSDVGAFVLGRLLGRHKMAPRISPNKTWEGAVGNVLGAYLGMALMSFALPDQGFWLLLAALPLVAALGAIWGDLVESAIKREFAAKDAGTWLPGFGGLLDRIDSLVIVAPLTYYFLRFLG